MQTRSMCLATVLALVGATSATATPFAFSRITSNSTSDVAGQLSMDVSASGLQILFKFTNAGPVDSFIGQIYFDGSDSLLSNLTILDDTHAATSTGVAFSESFSGPGNLPGGNDATPAFAKPPDLAVGAVAQGSSGSGVHEGLMLGLLFDGTLSDVLTALDSGDLRVGLHVQGIAPDGESDGFVNTTSHPEPSTLILVGLLSMIPVYLGLRRRLSG